MPIVHRYRCPNGHVTEAVVRRGVEVIDCPVDGCGAQAPKFWGGEWRGRSTGEGHVHDVAGLGKVTSEQLTAHLAKLRRRTGAEFVVEPATKSSVRATIDDIDHECWLLDKAEGESKERQQERAQDIAAAVAPRVEKVREAGGSATEQYDAMKLARAEFNAENPI